MKTKKSKSQSKAAPVLTEAQKWMVLDGPERTCVYCGCTDTRACPGGCSWVIVFQYGNAGVCSQCTVPHIPVQSIRGRKA